MIKTITFALIHFTITIQVAFLLTGDLLLCNLIAMIEPSINTIAFYAHEKAWEQSPLLSQYNEMTKVKTGSFTVIHFNVGL